MIRVKTMTDIKDVPAEVRWEIATRSATAMPLAYDIFFREVLGEKFDVIEKQIWIEGGKQAKGLTQDLALPVGNAREVNNSWAVLSLVLFGPEIRRKAVEETENRAVDKITGCPFLNRANEMGLDPKRLFETCQAYKKSIVEILNPRYTQRFGSGMCLGDPYCESIIELKT
jgi:hypothetical protein